MARAAAIDCCSCCHHERSRRCFRRCAAPDTGCSLGSISQVQTQKREGTLHDRAIHVPLLDLWHEHTPDLLHDAFKPPDTTLKLDRSCRGNRAARRRSKVAARRVYLEIVIVLEPAASAQQARTCCAAEASGHTCWAARVALTQTHRR